MSWKTFRTATYGKALWGQSQRPVLALLLVMFAYSALWSMSRSKLLYSEERTQVVDFIRVAEGRWDLVATPQPPLYVALGGLGVLLFGETPPAMRVLGGLTFLATLLLIPELCWEYITDRIEARRTATIALVMYAIHPLAIQGSILVDLDNTLLTPVTMLFLIAVARADSRAGLSRELLIGSGFALLLWTKLLPTPLLLALCIAAVDAVARNRFTNTLAGLAIGLLFLIASLIVIAKLIDFPLSTLTPTIIRIGEPVRAGASTMLSRTVMGGGITAAWMGLPFLGLFTWTATDNIRSAIHRRRPERADTLIIFSAISFLVFVAGNDLPHGFPRYHYPLLVLMVVIVARHLARTDMVRGRKLLFSLALLSANVMYYTLVIPDPLLPNYALTFETAELLRRLATGMETQAIGLFIPLAVSWASYLLLWRRFSSSFVYAAVTVSLASWAVLSVSQARADYATGYEYGRQGAPQVTQAVLERTTGQDNIVAPVEIILASGREGVNVLEYVCPSCRAEEWLSYMQSKRPAVYALTTKEDGRYVQVSRDTRVSDFLTRCYSSPSQIGSYLLYFRVPCGP